MKPASVPPTPPVFSRASIRAMGPLGEEIAALLLEAGYIRIEDTGRVPS